MTTNPYTGEPLPLDQYVPNVIDPPKKTEANDDTDPRKKVKNYFMDYISSPVYSKRLQNMGYKSPIRESAERLNNVLRTGVVDQEKSPGLFGQIKNSINGKIYSTVGSKFDQNSQNIILDREQIDKFRKQYANMSENEVLAHEYGHAINYSKDVNHRLNETEFNALHEKLKPTVRDRHSKSAEENYSDIQAYRYLLNEQGIYDTTKDNFSKEHIKSSEPTFIKERLLKNYSEEDLIWLMNNIADNGNGNKERTNQRTA